MRSEKDGTFIIKPEKCTECLGYFDDPQCVAVCPVEDTCVIDNTIRVTKRPREQDGIDDYTQRQKIH